ncbi:apurinic/apyrimidinic endonuclease-like protein [Trichoderma citrinoviride]|uniref:Apurinic-apyrimidinic endonuclease 1 n=1 Tax=Trichoderma citrinoviride TaxID=58853 RepID=A0A2T4B434_9HYPO|nr:apurinic/apyrimidinic endonuclease-like protein [Trichoderma citrinoviride]PTB64084.1 apurinic/apyrimidinic endonuclease-like protein [Trichoderma citrinoviride]
MPRPTRGSRTAIKREELDDDGIIDSKPAKPIVSRPKRKAEADSDDDDAKPLVNGSPKKEVQQKKKRKSKAVKEEEEEAMVLAERTAVSTLARAMYIGAHVSAAGGVHNSVTNALHIGANSFALFLKSQRKWANPPMTPDAQNGFISQCKQHRYLANEHVLPHGSYLVNLAQADADKAQQAYDSFVDDLARCEQLGIRLYNFHPGSTGGDAKAAAIGRIAAQLNRAHKATTTVVTVLENMAGSGNVVGSTWEDLRDIIALVEDKARVGVCIDTCHAFAAGYDLRTPEAFKRTVDSFNDIVGAKYLKAFHLNDSKAPLNSNRDLHANIGTGFLGLRAFHNVMNHPDFQDKPMVLETPIERKTPDGKTVEDKQVWADEIKLLESLVGMDPDTKEFARLEAELQARGADERRRIQEQVDKKASKGAKKKTGKTKKGVKKEETSDGESC